MRIASTKVDRIDTLEHRSVFLSCLLRQAEYSAQGILFTAGDIQRQVESNGGPSPIMYFVAGRVRRDAASGKCA